MPAMIVWPVSLSVRTRNVGSSSASLASAWPSFSCSALVLGSIAMSMTGSGKTIDSSSTGASSAHSVSPVVVFLRPTAATMSPADDLLDVLAVVRVHLQQATDALLVALGGVQHVRAGVERAGVDAEVGELADVRVGHDLERERRERRLGVCGTLDLLAGLEVDALDRGDVERRGQEVDDRVEQRLDALVLERRAARDRRDRAVAMHRLAQRGLDLVDGELLVLEELLMSSSSYSAAASTSSWR